MPDGFFEQKGPAAEVKHAILREYLSVFAGKVGRYSPRGRVAYLDGFAGPGIYGDESPGSPLIAADVSRLLSGTRHLRGFFVEERSDHARALRATLAEAGRDDWQVWDQPAEEALPAVLERVGPDPLLVFLDPHGLAVPFEMLVDEVMARRQITDVMMYFTQDGIARLAGLYRPEWWVDVQRDRAAVTAERGEAEVARLEASRSKGLQRLDAFLGGSWWHRHVEDARPTWKQDLRDEYIHRVIDAAASEWQHYLTPVPQRWEGPRVYELILFTRSPHGLWAFNNATAAAFHQLYERHWTRPGETLSLFSDGHGVPDPRPDYITQIKSRIRDALDRGHGGFQVADELDLFLDGRLRGRAGAREIRMALQQLHDEGVLGGERPTSKRLEYYVVERR